MPSIDVALSCHLLGVLSVLAFILHSSSVVMTSRDPYDAAR